MNTTIILAIIAIIGVAIIIWHCFAIGQIRKRRTALDMRENLLEERENLLEIFNPLKRLSASYTVTESDELNYDTESKAFLATVKNRIALTLVHDMIRQFGLKEDRTPDGKKRYSITIEARNDDESR